MAHLVIVIDVILIETVTTGLAETAATVDTVVVTTMIDVVTPPTVFREKIFVCAAISIDAIDFDTANTIVVADEDVTMTATKGERIVMLILVLMIPMNDRSLSWTILLLRLSVLHCQANEIFH